MDFKLVSKNNVGVVTTLILVILLSQSKIFNFLTDTPAGRSILLGFVIYIAYTHKIMGLVAVLFIIIAFNINGTNTVHSYNFYEGFDVPLTDTKPDETKTNDTKTNNTKTNNTKTNNTKTNEEKDKKDKLKKAKELKDSLTAVKSSNKLNDTSVASSSTVSGREGFCMSDKEINMLRGKPSNAIPVYNNNREQSDDVSPTDKTVFSDSYASF
jgi:hypothetical protein